MKIKIIFSICAIISLVIGSCANPGLRSNVAESKSTEEVESQIFKNLDTGNSEDFDLERVNDEPIEMAADSNISASDTTVAVDDYIWRELAIAHDYYTMGVIANREAAWEEAQYYFEKGLSILSLLDIDVDADSLSKEAAKYSVLLADIFAHYKTTLLSLGHLPSDVSSDALMTRFSEINHIKIDSTELKKLETYAEEKISYNVPIVMNERVKKAILYYQTVAREPVERYLSRSTKYIPMIDSIFTEMGVPTDIKYLAMVESGYYPHAYSRARAMGLWQFIASTGRMYDLNRSWWYDERKDPVKATVAAARFLKDLYNQFGSWELAMAAYNGGPGRVSKQIKRQNTKDFWKLNLRKQTEDYVPFFMAATIISKNPEKFGFTDIDYQSKWEYDVVEIDKCLDLKTIADAIGCTVDDLKSHNPKLLRRFTPPNKKKYQLRIPKGTSAEFWAAYDKMPSSKETSFVRHEIRKGETISTIARKYGISQYAIFEANNLTRHSKIYAGKSLIVPVPNDREYTYEAKKEYKADGNVYVVRSGDTVWDIARAFKISTANIRKFNDLDRKAQIYVGQQLIVGKEASPSQATATVAQKNSNQNSKSSSVADGIYVVKKGDSLWEIANRFGMTTTQLKNMNNLGRSSKIFPGQNLKVVGSDGDDYQIYVVKRGDTISEIADLFKVPMSRLVAWNNISDPSGLRVGTKLKIFTN
ncbi:MAG: LysM peptidoglycan-binding domain-containing protein [Candidatus Zixiibacteriota bacterium]